MNGDAMRDRERLISDYVLGQASEEENLWTEQRMVEEDDLCAEIRGLRERLHELDYSAKPALVTRDLWSGIEDKLEEAAATEEDSAVVELEEYRPAQTPGVSNGYWKGFITSAIAASILFVVATTAFVTLQKPAEPVVIAVLLDSEAKPGAIVEALDDDRVRVVPLVNINVPAGRSLEVWTLQDPEAGPVSLGLMKASAETTLTDFELPRPNADQLYEISLEPAAGSPIGRPTGPVLFKGFAKIPR